MFIDIAANLQDSKVLLNTYYLLSNFSLRLAYVVKSQVKGIYYEKQTHSPDLDVVLTRAQKYSVKKIIAVSGSLEELKEVIDICEKYDPDKKYLFCTVGYHPTRTNLLEGKWDNIKDDLVDFAKDNLDRIVAIGEIGLDYDRLQYSPKDVQLKYFESQLEFLCSKLKLPLFLHSRAAHNDFKSLLIKYKHLWENVGGVVHSFTGTCEESKELLDLGLDIGLNGCSIRTEDSLKLVSQLPLDRIHFETDSPWCSIRPNHPSSKYVKTHFEMKQSFKFKNNQFKPDDILITHRNEPCCVVNVAEVVAGVHSEKLPFEDLCAIDFDVIIENYIKISNNKRPEDISNEVQHMWFELLKVLQNVTCPFEIYIFKCIKAAHSINMLIKYYDQVELNKAVLYKKTEQLRIETIDCLINFAQTITANLVQIDIPIFSLISHILLLAVDVIKTLKLTRENLQSILSKLYDMLLNYEWPQNGKLMLQLIDIINDSDYDLWYIYNQQCVEDIEKSLSLLCKKEEPVLIASLRKLNNLVHFLDLLLLAFYDNPQKKPKLQKYLLITALDTLCSLLDNYMKTVEYIMEMDFNPDKIISKCLIKCFECLVNYMHRLSERVPKAYFLIYCQKVYEIINIIKFENIQNESFLKGHLFLSSSLLQIHQWFENTIDNKQFIPFYILSLVEGDGVAINSKNLMMKVNDEDIIKIFANKLDFESLYKTYVEWCSINNFPFLLKLIITRIKKFIDLNVVTKLDDARFCAACSLLLELLKTHPAFFEFILMDILSLIQILLQKKNSSSNLNVYQNKAELKEIASVIYNLIVYIPSQEKFEINFSLINLCTNEKLKSTVEIIPDIFVPKNQEDVEEKSSNLYYLKTNNINNVAAHDNKVATDANTVEKSNDLESVNDNSIIQDYQQPFVDNILSVKSEHEIDVMIDSKEEIEDTKLTNSSSNSSLLAENTTEMHIEEITSPNDFNGAEIDNLNNILHDNISSEKPYEQITSDNINKNEDTISKDNQICTNADEGLIGTPSNNLLPDYNDELSDYFAVLNSMNNKLKDTNFLDEVGL